MTLEERRQSFRANHRGNRIYPCPICGNNTDLAHFGGARYSEETLARHISEFHKRLDVTELVQLSVKTCLEDFIRV